MTKKRLVKRAVALLATAVMMVGMVIPAMATVTGPNVEKGTITVHKYSGNRGSVNQNYTGEELSPAEISKITNAGYKPLADAGFTLYQADETQLDAIRDAMRENQGHKVVGHTIDTTSGPTPVIKFTMIGHTVSYDVNTTLYKAQQKTDENGITKFGNGDIPNGYYVLVETETPEGYDPAAPSLIQLPLAAENGQQHYDIHVYPKNVSKINLAVKDMHDVDQPVEQEDVLTFDLKLKFINGKKQPSPLAVEGVNDLKDGSVYGIAQITEYLSDYFVYEQNSLEVRWLTDEGEIDTTAAGVIPQANYTLTGMPAPGAKGGEIVVKLNDAGIDAAIGGTKTGFGLVLSAEYVGFPIGDQVAHMIVNRMEGLLRPATYDPENPPPHDPDDPDEPLEDEIFAPSLTIKVNKRDGVTEKILPGVTFALATVPVPVPYDPRLTYALGALDDDYVLGQDGKPITAMSNHLGELFFSRLEGFKDATGAKFYLKEIETADNYKLKINTIEVTFDNKAYYQEHEPLWFNGEKWKQNSANQKVAVVDNYRTDGPQDPDEFGFSLPLTGGAGTIMFTIIGAAVMLGAAMLIIKRKKKEA